MRFIVTSDMENQKEPCRLEASRKPPMRHPARRRNARQRETPTFGGYRGEAQDCKAEGDLHARVLES
jgi:hypothetical protein